MDKSLADKIVRGRRAINLARQKGLDTTEWENKLKELFDEAGKKPGPEADLEPLMLWHWRRASIPQWRINLKDSIERGDARREEYARWMLREILLDPDYEEPTND